MAKRGPGETQIALSRAKEEIDIVHTPLYVGGITSEAYGSAEADIQNGKGYMHRNQLPGAVGRF
jgi:predicted transcriptional regulator of viral defense system